MATGTTSATTPRSPSTPAPRSPSIARPPPTDRPAAAVGAVRDPAVGPGRRSGRRRRSASARSACGCCTRRATPKARSACSPRTTACCSAATRCSPAAGAGRSPRRRPGGDGRSIGRLPTRGPGRGLPGHGASTTIGRERAWLDLVRQRGPVMRSYLIVANQTLTGQALADAMAERLADGPVRAHVVVPLTRVGGRLTWDEAASRGGRPGTSRRCPRTSAHARRRGRRRDRRLRSGLGRSRRRCAAARSTRSSSRPCHAAFALARRGRPEPIARQRPVPVTVVTQTRAAAG